MKRVLFVPILQIRKQRHQEVKIHGKITQLVSGTAEIHTQHSWASTILQSCHIGFGFTFVEFGWFRSEVILYVPSSTLLIMRANCQRQVGAPQLLRSWSRHLDFP